MNEPEELSDHWKELIDGYLDGHLDEAGMQGLEGYLRADGSIRQYFVRYARLHTDLYLETRARDAASRALGRVEELVLASKSEIQERATDGTRMKHGKDRKGIYVRALSVFHPWPRFAAVAAGLLVAIIAGGLLARGW
jgi:hypothetical protein